MSPESIRQMLDRTPFVPFRMHLSDQHHYDITQPAMVMVFGSVVVVGQNRNIQSQFFDEPIIVANRHITRLEPLITAEV